MEINGWNGETYGKQDSSASTAGDHPKKSKIPPDAVSILPVGMRSLPEAEVHKKGLRLWKRAGQKERLAAVGGIVADSGYIDTGRWRWWQRICGTETEEMWDDEDFILG